MHLHWTEALLSAAAAVVAAMVAAGKHAVANVAVAAVAATAAAASATPDATWESQDPAYSHASPSQMSMPC